MRLASYYKRYMKGFAAIASPLHKLMKKDVVYPRMPGYIFTTKTSADYGPNTFFS